MTRTYLVTVEADHAFRAETTREMSMSEPRPAPVPDDDVGGDPACWMHRVCDECGRLADEDPPTRCPSCGAWLEAG